MDVAGLASAWIEIGRRLDQRGILAGTEGNFSQRLPDGRVLITARGAFKGRLGAEDFSVIDASGRRIEGAEPSSEWRMHLGIYAVQEARAVVHAHPPFATALAVAATPLPVEFLPELVSEFGAIPLVPYATPGSEQLRVAIERHFRKGNAALLERHGIVTLGGDPWQACARMEMLERAAQVFTLTRILKGEAGALSAEQARALSHPSRDG